MSEQMPESTNPYAAPSGSPPTPGRPPLVQSSSMFAVAVLATVVLQVTIHLSREALTRIYADWGAELPFSTQIAFSTWPVSLSGLLFIITFVKELFVKHEASSRGWNEMVILVAVVFGFVYGIAALLPFLAIGHSLA